MDIVEVRKNLIENYYKIYDILLADRALVLSSTEHKRALAAAKLLIEAADLLQNDYIYNVFNVNQEEK